MSAAEGRQRSVSQSRQLRRRPRLWARTEQPARTRTIVVPFMPLLCCQHRRWPLDCAQACGDWARQSFGLQCWFAVRHLRSAGSFCSAGVAHTLTMHASPVQCTTVPDVFPASSLQRFVNAAVCTHLVLLYTHPRSGNLCNRQARRPTR